MIVLPNVSQNIVVGIRNILGNGVIVDTNHLAHMLNVFKGHLLWISVVLFPVVWNPNPVVTLFQIKHVMTKVV